MTCTGEYRIDKMRQPAVAQGEMDRIFRIEKSCSSLLKHLRPDCEGHGIHQRSR